MNTFGHILRLTTFGESHGPALGGVIDGFPAGVAVDMDFVRAELARRRPGAGPQRKGRRRKSFRRRPCLRYYICTTSSAGFSQGQRFVTWRTGPSSSP